MPHGPHVQGAAPADDQVRPGDELRSQRRGETAGDAQVEGLTVEEPVGNCRGSHECAAGLRQGENRVAGAPSPAAGDKNGTFCLPEELHELLDCRRIGTQTGGWLEGYVVEGTGCRGLLHIQGKAQDNGPPFVNRCAEGPNGVRHGGLSGVDPFGHRPDTPGKSVLVNLEVRSHRRALRVGRQDDHRRAALSRLPDPGDRVAQATALVRTDDANPVGHPGVGVRHSRGAAFMPGRREGHP